MGTDRLPLMKRLPGLAASSSAMHPARTGPMTTATNSARFSMMLSQSISCVSGEDSPIGTKVTPDTSGLHQYRLDMLQVRDAEPRGQHAPSATPAFNMSL